jgi:phosphomannomutase
MLSTKAIIQESGWGFGTSGVRSLVSQLTTKACQAFTHSFIATMNGCYAFNKVALGMDNRPRAKSLCSGAETAWA